MSDNTEDKAFGRLFNMMQSTTISAQTAASRNVTESLGSSRRVCCRAVVMAQAALEFTACYFQCLFSSKYKV